MGKREDKRWKREHRKKPNGNSSTEDNGTRVVYTPKTEEEAQLRVDRAKQLIGTPFVSLPDITDHSVILFTAKDGTPISAEAVEMVFNDAHCMDYISNWGEYGPLYRDTLDNERHREAYEYALKAYAGVELPEKYKRSIQ